MDNVRVFVFAALLTLFGVGLASYKFLFLGYPVLPGANDDLWIVEAHVSFSGLNRPVKASVFIPDQTPVYILEDESFVSQGFGLSTLREGDNRLAVWAIRRVAGEVDLYYRTAIREYPALTDPQRIAAQNKVKPPSKEQVNWSGMEKDAALAVVDKVSALSADPETLVRQILHEVSHPEPRSSALHLLGPRPTSLKRASVARKLLNMASVPARVVQGISLRESSNSLNLEPRVEVYFDNFWYLFEPETGVQTSWRLFLPWFRGEVDPLEIKGGSRFKYAISVQRMQEAAVSVALHLSRKSHPYLSAFSLYSLPVEVQNVYRVLLMIPVGAFVVVILRNFIGLKTLGTFMPVLIALSFRESDPFWGGLLFTAIVALALLVRAYFEHLRLLLVPRLACILTVIILLMLLASLLLTNLGIERGLSVALFPMVILTMVVERMSILWDELGARVAVRQGMLTLAVALIVYYVIGVSYISHIMFVFPELLLLLLAFNLLIGRYTGYRLTELYRFSSIKGDL